MKKIKKCVCCGKKIINLMGGQKYCNACGVFTRNLRHKISGLKGQLKRMTIIAYGQKSGSERIRWKKQK